jgi:hypothetical protein
LGVLGNSSSASIEEVGGEGATWCDQAAVAPPRPRTADMAGGDGAVTGAEEEEQRSLAESAHEEEGGGRGLHTQSNT